MPLMSRDEKNMPEAPDPLEECPQGNNTTAVTMEGALNLEIGNGLMN